MVGVGVKRGSSSNNGESGYQSSSGQMSRVCMRVPHDHHAIHSRFSWARRMVQWLRPDSEYPVSQKDVFLV